MARLVVDRKTNPQIASELFLSQKTVETHLHNIFRKIDVSTRVELARVSSTPTTARASFTLVAPGRLGRSGSAVEKQGAGSGWRPDVAAARQRQAGPCHWKPRSEALRAGATRKGGATPCSR